jgi:hypothetical protein
MASKLSLIFNKSKFVDFISKLKDLTNIDDTIKIKIDKSGILIYSTLANDVSVLALKSYYLKTEDYIDNFDSEYTFDYIITSATKIVKNLSFFDTNVAVKLDIVYKELPEDDTIMHVRSGQFSNGKLKISCIGAEYYKIRDINSTVLEARLDRKNAKWTFEISQSDFLDVKKLASINSEDRIMLVNVLNGKVTISETAKWEIEIDEIDFKNTTLTLLKKYLSNINAENSIIRFDIFETFILVKDDNSNLMMSFEQDFDTED